MGKWKKYYRIEFVLASGLNISGDSVNTDKDVLRNGAGEPFIPGSSLAGMYRACFTQKAQQDAFGYVKIHGQEEKQLASANEDGNTQENAQQTESRVKVYDATLMGACTVSERDGVGLDAYKTARDGAKYDYEVVEKGARFVTFVEQDGESENDFGYIDAIAGLWKDKRICIGGKTRRGLGAVKDVKIKYAKFNLECDEDRTSWLDFDMYMDQGYTDNHDAGNDGKHNFLKKDTRVTLDLKLRLRGAISIRKYTTKGHTEGNKEASMPDYETLCNHDGKPVIPGTSWAGLFRHSLVVQGVEEQVRKGLFGTTEKQSNISFSESIIEGGESKVISRTAIDRFTGGAASGALYTERTHYGGTTNLTISYEPGTHATEILKGLATTIADLNAGFIALGGLTSVGRGLFFVEEVRKNGVEIKIEGKDEIERSQNIYRELTTNSKTEEREDTE